MLDAIAAFGHYLLLAMDALDSIVMTIAIVLTAAIFASVGGMTGARMRLYGAIVGGMLVNIVVKAMGGGYAAALAAMLVTTALAYGIGSAPFLVQLVKRVRR